MSQMTATPGSFRIKASIPTPGPAGFRIRPRILGNDAGCLQGALLPRAGRRRSAGSRGGSRDPPRGWAFLSLGFLFLNNGACICLNMTDSRCTAWDPEVLGVSLCCCTFNKQLVADIQRSVGFGIFRTGRSEPGPSPPSGIPERS